MQTFRNNLIVGDPLRNWTAVWNYLGLQSVAALLTDKDGKLVPIIESHLARRGGADAYYRIITIADTTLPGDYTLTIGGDTLVLSVAGKYAPKKLARMNAGAELATVQKAINAGNHVILAPGRYAWSHALNLIPGSEWSGDGAVIERIPDNDYGCRMVSGGKDSTIRGITFEPCVLTYHDYAELKGLVFQGVTIKNNRFGYAFTDALIMDCLFDRADCTYASPGLYLRNRFKENNNEHAFGYFAARNSGKMAMMDNDFDGTDRGPIFNLNAGNITDGLYIGTTLKNINRGFNGNEIFNVEGAPQYEFSRNLIMGTYADNCDSSLIQFWDAQANDNRIFNTVQNGGTGFWLCGVNGAKQTGNIFDTFEFRDAGLTIGNLPFWGPTNNGANVTDNIFSNGAFIGYKPTKGNQDYVKPELYLRPAVAYSSVANNNVLRNVSFYQVPNNMKAEYNFNIETPGVITS